MLLAHPENSFIIWNHWEVKLFKRSDRRQFPKRIHSIFDLSDKNVTDQLQLAKFLFCLSINIVWQYTKPISVRHSLSVVNKHISWVLFESKMIWPVGLLYIFPPYYVIPCQYYTSKQRSLNSCWKWRINHQVGALFEKK